MKKIQTCPNCSEESPNLTLRLQHPEEYEFGSDIVPDTRHYELVCLHCGVVVDSQVIDNTLSAVKELRDELDARYGPSHTYPSWLFVNRR